MYCSRPPEVDGDDDRVVVLEANQRFTKFIHPFGPGLEIDTRGLQPLSPRRGRASE